MQYNMKNPKNKASLSAMMAQASAFFNTFLEPLSRDPFPRVPFSVSFWHNRARRGK
jgi:hypothetical protein